MRLMKMLGLAALAAVAAMAFLGASSASAEYPSALCTQLEHECEPENLVEKFHLTLTKEGEGGVGVLHGLSPLFLVLCLSALVLGKVLKAGTGKALSNAGTPLESLVDLLTTELENGSGNGTASVTGLNGETLVNCNIPLIGEIDCIYEGKGLEFEAANPGERGMLNASETPVKKTAGSGFCSEQSTITSGLLEPSERQSPVVCTAHEVPCSEENKVSELAVESSSSPVLLNSIANVECDTSSASAKALEMEKGGSEPFDATSLTWSECHTQGADGNCTVETTSLPALGISRSSLNVGTASTSGGVVHVICDILGLVELNCTYPLPASLEVKGALQEEGVGNGRISASKASVEVVEAKEGCPETAKWDLAYEPAKHVYLVESSSLVEKVYILS